MYIYYIYYKTFFDISDSSVKTKKTNCRLSFVDAFGGSDRTSVLLRVFRSQKPCFHADSAFFCHISFTIGFFVVTSLP